MHAPAALHLEDTRPADGLLALATLALGVTGVLLFVLGAPREANWAGLVGLFTGLWAQMVSRTRAERFADVIGMVVCALALALGAADADLTFP